MRNDDLCAIAREVRDECLAFRVRRLNRRVTRIYDAVLRPLGLTVAQFNVLVALGLGVDLTARDLAHALDLEKSTLSRNVKRLVVRRLVTISGDRRLLELTAAGRRLLARALPAWREAQREAAVAIDAELRTAEALHEVIRRPNRMAVVERR